MSVDAERANTMHSTSELLASRLAPCRQCRRLADRVQARQVGAADRSVWMPPQV